LGVSLVLVSKKGAINRNKESAPRLLLLLSYIIYNIRETARERCDYELYAAAEKRIKKEGAATPNQLAWAHLTGT